MVDDYLQSVLKSNTFGVGSVPAPTMVHAGGMLLVGKPLNREIPDR